MVITAITTDSGTSSSDFITSDTTLTVSGTHGPLGAGEKVQVSSDGGANWADVTTSTATTWSFTDPTTHATSFTYQARVIGAAGNVGANTASQAVTIDTAAPTAPSITSIPENGGGGINAGEASDGTPVVVGLSGTGAVAGDTLTINWGGQTVSYTLLAGDISGNSATVTVPLATIGAAGPGHVQRDGHGDRCGGQPWRRLGGIPGHHRHVGAGGAGDRQRDRRRGAGDRPVANNGRSNDTTLTIGGTAEAGSTVTVYDTDGTTVLGTGVATGGAFTITTSVLGEGAHALTARATDAAGNQGAYATAFHVTIDTVAPVAPSITAFSVDSGTAGDHLTNDTTLTLSGTAGAAGNTVEIFRDGVSIGTTVADVGGNWSLADASSLADGAYQFTARATDGAGNQGPLSAAFQVTIDATAPGAPTFGSVTDNVAPVIGLVADNGSSNDPTLSIDGTAELGSTVTVYDTDGTTVVGTGVATGGAGPITTSALSEGAHTLTLKATDAAGNQSAASTAFHVTIDTVAPVAPVIVSVTDDVAPVTGAVADNGSSNDPTLTIGGTAEAGSTVTVYDTDGTTVLGTGVATGGVFTITTSVLGEGAHALTAKASDAAGNQSAASAAFQVIIDTLAPVAPVIVSVTDDAAPVTGLVANNGSSNDTTLTIGGTAEAGSTVTVYDTDGTTVLGTGVATGGAFTITTSVLGEGAHTLTARATDAAGNQGASSTAFHVTIDTVAPVAPSITAFSVDSGTAGDHLTNDTTLTLSGTAGAAGNTVEIFQDGVSIGTTVADVGGNWSLADASSLADGAYQFTARATDGAGNQGPLSAAFQVTIDATAPGAPTFGSVTDNVAPVIGLVADNGSSNDPTLSIDGTAELGSTVTVYDTDGTTVVGTGVATGGAGPITTSALSEGAHTLTLKATDAAGNQSAGLDGVPRHHRHGGAGGAGDRQRDRRRGAGDRRGGGQRQLERPHADDRRDGGGGQHGDGLRHRRHDGAGDRRGDRRGVHDHDLGAGRGRPCADGQGERCGGQPKCCLGGIPGHHRHRWRRWRR